jgi:hypothetical protein
MTRCPDAGPASDEEKAEQAVLALLLEEQPSLQLMAVARPRAVRGPGDRVILHRSTSSCAGPGGRRKRRHEMPEEGLEPPTRGL